MTPRGAGSNDPAQHQADEINQVIKSRAAEYRACYTKQLERDPELSGRFAYRLEVAADGKVTLVRPVAPTAKSKQLDACIRAAMLRLQFAAKGKTTITYPLLFAKGG